MKWLFIGTALLSMACVSTQRIPWTSKRGWVKCKPMVRAYPRQPAPSCSALHMCANEAPLNEVEYAKLIAIMKAQPGCGLP